MDSENIPSQMSAIDTVTTSIDTENSDGFFKKMFHDFSFDSFLEKLNLSRENLLEIALYFGSGFLLGFFFKKYHHYVIAMIFFIVALYIADYCTIISVTINTDNIKALLGCSTMPADATLFSCLMHMIQERVRASVSFISGFIIGIWVG
jgi:uncharacterized membrane protein (Fun14 family)